MQRSQKEEKKISVLLTVCHIWPFGVKINRFIFPWAEIRPLNRLFKTLNHFFDKQIEWNPVQLKIQCKSIWDKVVEPVVWRWSRWLEDLVCRCICAQLIEYPIKCYKLIEHSFFLVLFCSVRFILSILQIIHFRSHPKKSPNKNRCRFLFISFPSHVVQKLVLIFVLVQNGLKFWK